MPYSLPSDTRYILYEETDLAQLKQKPCHFKCGIYLICTHGQALISTGVQQYIFEEQTELIFLTGSLIQVVQSSYDFKARILMFPQEVFLKAVLPIDTPYYNYTHEHPCYHHTEDERSQKTWKEINLWMDMAQMQFMDNTPQFRQQQEYNFRKLPVKYVLQNRKISPDSVRFVQIRLRVGTNSIKLYQFGTDLL